MNAVFIFSVLLLLAIVLAGYMWVSSNKRSLRSGARRAVQNAWLTVETEKNVILKLVEADKVLDEALRLLGYTGTLGEKLKVAGPRMSNLNDVWWAHKLRNAAVHNLSSKPHQKDIDRSIVIFQKALNDLGAKI